MPDVKNAKIRKKEYHFELKQKYEYVGHYKAVERPPIDKIKDALRSFISPPKVEKKAEKKALTAPPKGGFNFAVFGAAVLIGIIILSLGWIYVTTALAETPSGFMEQPERPVIQNTLLEGDVLSAGERGDPQYVATVLVQYDTKNVDNYTIELTPYDTRLPSEIFILNSERKEATSYPDFLRVLRSDLSRRNIILNEITLKELETIPQGALVIVPSGFVPKELVGFDSPITMRKLADRGVVVLYIGQPFTKVLNGTLVVSTSEDFLEGLPVSFDEQSQISSSGNFSLFQPLYRAVGRGQWKSKMVYGSVSAVTRGDGAFIFVPQTLDGGWRGDYEEAANDIAMIITENPWAEAAGKTNTYVFSNQTDYSDSRYFFTETFSSPNTTIKVDFTGYSEATNIPVYETLYLPIDKDNPNQLTIKDGFKVVPTNITQNLARITAELNEAQPGEQEMFLLILDDEGNEVQNFPQGSVNVQADRSFDVPIYIPRGEYTLRLIDDESREYAKSYLKVVTIDIDFKGTSSRKASVYLFDITMDKIPVSLSEVTVVVDNDQYGTYKFNDVSTIQIDVGSRTGDQLLPVGNHTFTFTSGALVVDVPVVREARRTIFNDPIFWLVVIITGAVVGVGAIFARQESVYYSIDIPDFPPVTRTKIPLSPEVVMSLFQKVNENYRWQNTPLTPPEIKNGFKSIFVKGRPIFITDYNVEYLLEDLEKKGSVKGALGYYGLSDWEMKTKRSMDYLVLMRKLRDICVNNAVPFTGMGESKDADSVITVVGQQMYLHFFDKEGDVETMFTRVLHSINKGITIILFKDNSEKEQFESLLDSSPTVAPLILKMESDSKSLLFQTTEELEGMIKEFKGV